MDYMKILKRAWHIVWHYPALWVMGFVLALVGNSLGGNPSGNTFYRFNQNDFRDGARQFPNGDGSFQQFIERINHFMDTRFGSINEQTILTWAIIAGVVILVLVVLFTILKYVALNAHIRMVNQLEESGEKVGWQKGFRMGWSGAGRLFLIDLVVGIPTAIVVLVLFGCAALPLILGFSGGDASSVAGVVASVAIGLSVFLVILLAAFVIQLWLRFAYRLSALEGQGVIASLSQAWKVFRKSLKDILLMWLILVGVQIAFGIAMIPIVLIFSALVIGVIGGVGVLVYALAAEFSVGLVILGVVLLFVLLGIPITILRGLAESFYESVWTLVYRETRVQPLDAPVVVVEPS